MPGSSVGPSYAPHTYMVHTLAAYIRQAHILHSGDALALAVRSHDHLPGVAFCSSHKWYYGYLR